MAKVLDGRPVRYSSNMTRSSSRSSSNGSTRQDPAVQLALHRQVAEAGLALVGGVWLEGTFPLGVRIWERLIGDGP